MSLFLASEASGLPVKLFKGIELKDVNLNGLKELQSETMDLFSIEIMPQNSLIPTRGHFLAEIHEDILNRALYFKIRFKKEEKIDYPYIVKFSTLSKTTVNFDYECSPFASAKDHLKLNKILNKIKNLDYRRVYIEDMDSNNIMISSCPEINIRNNKIEVELLENIIMLEEKLILDLAPPINFDNTLLPLTKLLLNNADDIENTQYAILKDEFVGKIQADKSTFVYVELLTANKMDYIRSLISHFSGWFNYEAFGFKQNLGNNSELKSIIKNQEPIKITANVRNYGPQEIFDLLDENNILQSLINYLNINDKQNLHFRSQVDIIFNKPLNNMQTINIVIKEADEEWNELLNLYKEQKYSDLIPYLEKFGSDNTNLAYSYVLNNRYDEAVKLANEVISQEMRSVAHMTKGLAYIGKEEFELAYESYYLGVKLCREWYPIAKENLLSFIKNNNISEGKNLTRVIELLSQEHKTMNLNEKCFCKSKRKLKKCHAHPNKFK